jgi:hypothetical protein
MLMACLLLIILILISASGVLTGFFLFLNPDLVIEIQRRFYERINWKIEPVSMSREIRNTKIMGLILIIVASTTIIYIIKII